MGVPADRGDGLLQALRVVAVIWALICRTLGHTWAVHDEEYDGLKFLPVWFCSRCGYYASRWETDAMEARGRFWR